MKERPPVHPFPAYDSERNFAILKQCLKWLQLTITDEHTGLLSGSQFIAKIGLVTVIWQTPLQYDDGPIPPTLKLALQTHVPLKSSSVNQFNTEKLHVNRFIVLLTGSIN